MHSIDTTPCLKPGYLPELFEGKLKGRYTDNCVRPRYLTEAFADRLAKIFLYHPIKEIINREVSIDWDAVVLDSQNEIQNQKQFDINLSSWDIEPSPKKESDSEDEGWLD